jgi:hypothetical protein
MDAPGLDPAWAVHAKLAFAALCGGITRLLFRPATSFVKTIWLLFGCVTCGFYGTPVIMNWWGMGQDYAGAVGAVLGFMGLSFAEAALKASDGWSAKVFEWIERKVKS